MKKTAIYLRVSSLQQTTISQQGDLEEWVRAHTSCRVEWYEDTFTGKTMDRPGFNRLLADVRGGLVERVVVWRLDRLGRTAAGLVSLFEELESRGVNLVSMREGLDLSTPAGRLLANMLASVAAYETEIRGERVRAGVDAAKAAGKKWGGSKKGRRYKVTEEKEAEVIRMLAAGNGPRYIAHVVGLSRPTIYKIRERVLAGGHS